MRAVITPCCRCDHQAPSARKIRSVEFNRLLATRIAELGLSGDATIDFLLDEILEHHSGRLFWPDGTRATFDSDVRADVDRFDRMFSEDQRRFINRYKARAGGGDFKYRLQERLIECVVMMMFALEIRECRTAGRCSGTSASAVGERQHTGYPNSAQT